MGTVSSPLAPSRKRLSRPLLLLLHVGTSLIGAPWRSQGRIAYKDDSEVRPSKVSGTEHEDWAAASNSSKTKNQIAHVEICHGCLELVPQGHKKISNDGLRCLGYKKTTS